MRKRVMALLLALATVLTGLTVGDYQVKAEESMIEQDIPVLRDSFDANFTTGTYAGVSLTNDEISNEYIMDLVTKHFNAVTLGNELKPDCMFGYSNSKAPELTTYELNGEEFEAPKMNFSKAEYMLNYFQKWNEEHPDRQIKIRGHVLVWHSQTPEWFFHENWDKKQPYVSKEEMTKRQEWYIKEVLTHFTTKYENMFYGWDVVNEAISDATGTYRTDTENGGALTDDTHGSKSSWWKVYQSNEYIINAFRFANKYAPDYVELYYNDYNECTPIKTGGIINLLTEVKNAEGTRIDGMGLQGHYDMSSPIGGQVKIAARRYAEIVGNVSLTELDLKASDSFDGSDEELKKELCRQYYRYKEIYTGLKELEEEGVTIRTITVWGVIDGHSWLQSQNNVGGGSNGSKRVIPLLFNDQFKAKPLFYALCNEPMPDVNKYLSTATEEAVEEVADAQAEEPEAIEAADEDKEDAATVEAEEPGTIEEPAKGLPEEDTVVVDPESGAAGPILGGIALLMCVAAVIFVKMKKN